MTLLLFLALQAVATQPPAPLPGNTAARFERCASLAKTDPARAVAEADAWRVGGGGWPARQCLGLAYTAQERWGPAVMAFEQAAREAELLRDGRAATLWVQAGNAALAGGDPSKARACLNAALALPVLSDAMRGEAYLDRARAQVALSDLAAARLDIDRGLTLVSQDPFGWLLSATLARRQNDLKRARHDIAEAARLAPGDPSIALEAGNIIAAAGADGGTGGAPRPQP